MQQLAGMYYVCVCVSVCQCVPGVTGVCQCVTGVCQCVSVCVKYKQR